MIVQVIRTSKIAGLHPLDDIVGRTSLSARLLPSLLVARLAVVLLVYRDLGVP